MHDPATGRAPLSLPRPLLQMAKPLVFGGLVIVLGIADLSS